MRCNGWDAGHSASGGPHPFCLHFVVVGDVGVSVSDQFQGGKHDFVEVFLELVRLAVGGTDEINAVLVKILTVHDGLELVIGFGKACGVNAAEFYEDIGDVAHGDLDARRLVAAGSVRSVKD